MTYADRIPAPRPIPGMSARFADARNCGHTPEQHRHLDGQDADTRSQDRAVRELTAERDKLAATIQAFNETHGNAAYLADNLAAVTSERDEYAADNLEERPR